MIKVPFLDVSILKQSIIYIYICLIASLALYPIRNIILYDAHAWCCHFCFLANIFVLLFHHKHTHNYPLTRITLLLVQRQRYPLTRITLLLVQRQRQRQLDTVTLVFKDHWSRDRHQLAFITILIFRPRIQASHENLLKSTARACVSYDSHTLWMCNLPSNKHCRFIRRLIIYLYNSAKCVVDR